MSSSFKGALPKPADFLAKADAVTVKVTPATKPMPVPVAFVSLMVDGKEVRMDMLTFPGHVSIPWSKESEGCIWYNKLTAFGTGPDESEHPAADRFAKEFLEWTQFTELLEAKIKEAVMANPLLFFKKAVDPSCVTVMPSVDQIGERGMGSAFKFELLNKDLRENFGADNVDTTVMEVSKDEEGVVKITPLSLSDIAYNDVVAIATSGVYITCNTMVNPLDKKTTGVVRMAWKVAMITRVAKGTKRQRDQAEVKAMWSSDAAKDIMADYL